MHPTFLKSEISKEKLSYIQTRTERSTEIWNAYIFQIRSWLCSFPANKRVDILSKDIGQQSVRKIFYSISSIRYNLHKNVTDISSSS